MDPTDCQMAFVPAEYQRSKKLKFKLNLVSRGLVQKFSNYPFSFSIGLTSISSWFASQFPFSPGRFDGTEFKTSSLRGWSNYIHWFLLLSCNIIPLKDSQAPEGL